MIQNEADIVVKLDEVYADETRPLRWNIFQPAVSSGQTAAVLLYHGGGWRVGDRASMTEAATGFARLGYVAIAPEYRLLGEAPWPAPLTDARTAIRAARAHAGPIGLAPHRIFLAGYSAGAYLALIAASGIAKPAGAHYPYTDQSEAVAGVAAFFPPARIDATVGEALGICDPEELAAMSPITHAGRYPPTIIFLRRRGLPDSTRAVSRSLPRHPRGGRRRRSAPLLEPDPRIRLPARNDANYHPRCRCFF